MNQLSFRYQFRPAIWQAEICSDQLLDQLSRNQFRPALRLATGPAGFQSPVQTTWVLETSSDQLSRDQFRLAQNGLAETMEDQPRLATRPAQTCPD